MTGHRPFSELTRGFSHERQERIRQSVHVELERMALSELRKAREKTQEELARLLHVGQPAIAKLEQRTDMYVSNLRRYVEALGGTLEIKARFPEADVLISNFEDLGDKP
jgi:DNA-binding XRE family transcriptional regulator